MSLRSLLTGESEEVQIGKLGEQKVMAKLSHLDLNRYQPWRCDIEINGQPVAGFGESPQEAVQNLKDFLNTH